MSRFVKDIRRLDKSAFSLTTGFRAAAFAITPIAVGFVTQQPVLLLATLGAIFLTNTEMQLPTVPSRILLLACFTEAASFGLGTLAATTVHSLTTLLLGIAVFVSLIARVNTKWAPVGTFTAIIFAIGVGLPGYSMQSAIVRTLFSLIGMLWALLGIEIHRFALLHRIQQPSQSESAASKQQPPTPRLAALRSALMIGIASAIGYMIGLVLGLPRDFWAVLTIIVAIRPSPSLTISFTSMMVFGTIIGALMAAVITLENTNPYLRIALLFSFAVMLFATMRVNVILTQIFLVPFIIILLNIYYPGEWYLSFIRILDVAIGGAIAVAMVYLWSALSPLRNRTS
ncbi:MAG TPA: FUSC family protein [Candidatus Bathyarchaeia archaeon]|nr:FUSC family protein [Candidatus Bathyarchaeia archaeon]